MKRLIVYFISISILFLYSLTPAFGQSLKLFRTKYATIYYSQDKDIDDFIWRLGGERLEFPTEAGLVSNRVDRIIERVETILDMRPKNFKINIYLHHGILEPNRVAFYEHKTKAIHVSVENSSDGVVAHEIAHAVINQYFTSPPPSKIQEILTQYVDKYLWSDY